MDLIKVAEEAFATGKQFPEFRAGDTVTVAYKITEGNKERIQLYRGVVIKIIGHGEKRRFTVRKMSGTIGVEPHLYNFTFPHLLLWLILAHETHDFKFTQFFHEILRKSLEFLSFQKQLYRLQ